jgi:hypothetical protein
VDAAEFFLMTGGGTTNAHVPLGRDIDRPPGGIPQLP